jgi:hypothetical protein
MENHFCFVERCKILRKKLNKFYGKITWKKVNFFLEVLPRSTKNKNCFPLKLNEYRLHTESLEFFGSKKF